MLSCLYFIKKRLFSKKNTLRSCLYFVNKTPFLSKIQFSCHFFFGIFMKNPMLSRPFLSRNVNSVKTTVYYRPKKSGCLVFSSIFHEKITALMHIFCQKTFLSPKKITTVLPYFVKKLSILSKTQSSNVIFYSNFHEKPSAVMPIFGKKKGNFC